MLTSIHVKFNLDSARLGLFNSANILQVADVALRVVVLLFFPCFLFVFLCGWLKRENETPFSYWNQPLVAQAILVGGNKSGVHPINRSLERL